MDSRTRRDDASSWANIPTELLLSELTRRREAGDDNAKPQCGSGKRGSYDTTLHVGALVLILCLSTISCGIPLLPRRSSSGRLQKRIVFYCQHFGTGVLLATAFVHLLPTAFLSLTDPCLPYLFNEGFPPMAGLVAMLAALTVVGLEQYLATRGAGHSHKHHYHFWDNDSEDFAGAAHKNARLPPTAAAGEGAVMNGGLAARRLGGHRPSDIALENAEATDGLMAGASPLHSGRASPAPPSFKVDGPEDGDSDSDLDMLELDTYPINGHGNGHSAGGPSRRKPPQTPTTPAPVSPEEQARLLRQCVMLEGGILFHSIFIGMAISVATGSTFIVFLIAISFHQTFEGLALGSRIAAIQLPSHSARPWLMVLAFGATTPIGQAIGLIVHNMYDPLSQTGLLMVGFMNSISSGLLLFAGLVQLLSEDFLTDKSYSTLTGAKRWRAYASVVSGAILMAVVGGFA
ncbi:zinc-regulated transporter 2 [Plectosphaerella cucumerina]|uniref:Zinc-regulated transporter 2 n=1 Tax=Plectosphaerella cucumerina TaxID=40658 RepID=A0A8K0TH27_9PEZI|nr:zinc-regulated transporter 2 [Plectosphaerella cucumerina]